MRSMKGAGVAALLAAAMVAIPQGFGQQGGIIAMPGSGVRRLDNPKTKKSGRPDAERIKQAEQKRERKNLKRLRDFQRSEQGRMAWAGVAA